MAPFNSRDDEDEDDTLFDDVSAMADRMRLQGEKRATYIDDHMTAAGYERVQSRESYSRIREQDEEDESGGNRWFGKSSSGGRSAGGRDRERMGGKRRDNDDTF